MPRPPEGRTLPDHHVKGTVSAPSPAGALVTPVSVGGIRLNCVPARKGEKGPLYVLGHDSGAPGLLARMYEWMAILGDFNVKLGQPLYLGSAGGWTKAKPKTGARQVGIGLEDGILLHPGAW